MDRHRNRCLALWALTSLCTTVSTLATPVKDPAQLGSRQSFGLSVRDGDDASDYDAGDTTPPCDFSKTYKTLDELNLAVLAGPVLGPAGAIAGIELGLAGTTMRTDCISIYTLQTLVTMLDTAYANYTSVNDGYDEEFGYYVTYMQKLVQPTLDDNFMFNLSLTTDTMTMLKPEVGLSFFDCKSDKSGSEVFPCSDLGSHDHEEDAAYQKTTLTLRDKDGFDDALGKAGLSPDWIVFGDHELHKDVSAPHGGRRFKYKFSGWPIEKDGFQPANPKSLVTSALPSISDLRADMQATVWDLMIGIYANGSIGDPAQAYSLPVFMLMSAVDSMAQAKALGKQEQKDEADEAKRKKNFILLIVSLVLMFVPVVGEEVALAAGFASLARAIAIAGEVGNAALATYDTISSPSSAIVNIFGMLLGVGAIAKATRDGPGIGDVARIRRGMSADAVAQLGAIPKDLDGKLQSVLKFCKH